LIFILKRPLASENATFYLFRKARSEEDGVSVAWSVSFQRGEWKQKGPLLWRFCSGERVRGGCFGRGKICIGWSAVVSTKDELEFHSGSSF